MKQYITLARVTPLPTCRCKLTGKLYPRRYQVVLHDHIGNRWDGGEYATHAEAAAVVNRHMEAHAANVQH